MSKYLKLGAYALASIFISLAVFVLSYLYFPVNIFDTSYGMLGATVTTINGSDTLKDSRTTINTNFTNLNNDKLEKSTFTSTTTMPNITTLSALSTIGTIISGIWHGSTITVPYGGTGAVSFLANTILYGNGTGAIQSTATGSVGQILSLNASGTPAWASPSVDTSIDYTWSGNHTFNGSSVFATTTFNKIPSTVTISTSSATSSVVNKDYLDYFGSRVDATDLLQAASDTAVSLIGATSTMYKRKEIVYNDVSGTVRVKFTLEGDTSNNRQVRARIYKNGSAYGTDRNITTATTYTEDLLFSRGDLIQIYGANATNAVNGQGIYNFSISYTKSLIGITNTVN